MPGKPKVIRLLPVWPHFEQSLASYEQRLFSAAITRTSTALERACLDLLVLAIPLDQVIDASFQPKAG